MKSNLLPVVMAIGLAAQPALATDDKSAARVQEGRGSAYGLTSGASGIMETEAGTDGGTEIGGLEMPQPQTQGDVTYVCGGIGQTEVNYMSRQARNYDLKLTFAAAQTGAFLANVDVNIQGAQGEPILQAQCDGPIMLVDLPRSGNYRVQADVAGDVQSRSVQVNDGRSASYVAMTWPQQTIAGMEGGVTSGGDTAGSRASGGINQIEGTR